MTYILEEFIDADCPFDIVEAVMTREDLMRRWMSPAVNFRPLDGWSFDEGKRWKLQLTGVGPLLEANYVVYERRPGLVLWAFDGFWEGFDAWHWWSDPRDQRRAIIQNRIEYSLSMPWLRPLWPPVAAAMRLDARAQMRRLQDVCERQVEPAPPTTNVLDAINQFVMQA